ncbi:MAG: DUF6089 family protein [Thermaurantimonas sp.]|uniref:DUF6089 family protein n=1 Tax=Thermaurantimonas sp. TaxID=2681568 RepID=UPI0039199155
MKKIFFSCILISVILFTYGQKSGYNYEQFGIMIGTINYSGDVTPNYSNPTNIIKEMRPTLGVGYYKGLSPFYIIGTEISHGILYANEANHRNVTRPFEFTSHIIQFNIINEIIARRFGKYYYTTKWAPYGKLGLGFGMVNPTLHKPEILNENVFERKDQMYFFVNYFIGGGIKLRIRYNYSLSIEGVFHFTNQDFLDGYLDKRVNSFNDTYGGIRLILSRYNFGKNLNVK